MPTHNKLSPQKIAEIRKVYAKGLSQSETARLCNVSRNAVRIYTDPTYKAKKAVEVQKYRSKYGDELHFRCMEQRRMWRLDPRNREKDRASNRKYRRANIEKEHQRSRRYRVNNREKVRQKARQYRVNNIEKERERSRIYRIRNWQAVYTHRRDNWRRYLENAMMRDWEVTKAFWKAHPEKMAKCPLYQ
jgi:hypothetical protein